MFLISMIKLLVEEQTRIREGANDLEARLLKRHLMDFVHVE